MPNATSAELLLLEGPDALAFAQAQFSSNVATLAVGAWQFSAWLDAQGRVRALFHLARLDEQCLWLLLRGGNAATLADELRRYVFRNRLTLRALPGLALGGGDAQPLHAVRHEADGIVLGCGAHGLRLAAGQHGDDAWRPAQRQMGWPWLPDAALAALLPPALSLHRLQAVAVDKGCYPGQEIVARLHWRGSHKRHLCLLHSAGALPAGTPLRRGGNAVGTLLDGADVDGRFEALAVLGDDLTRDAAAGAVLSFDEAPDVTLQQRWDD